MRKRSTLWQNIGLLLVTLLICLLLAEIGARIFSDVPYIDGQLGWAWHYPAVQDHLVNDTTTVQRTVQAQYFTHGFKRWGDVNTSKTKVLILGDSFTEMWYVNNGEEWYAYLEEAFPDTEFFVYGVGGWGTTQEYLLLRNHYDEIRPDVILLQFHYNDLINNYYPAEREQYPLNNRFIRPYYENGGFVYRTPAPYAWLRLHSALAMAVLRAYEAKEYNRLAANKGEAFYKELFGEDYRGKPFSEAKIWHDNFSVAFSATDSVFALIRGTTDVPIYFFSAENEVDVLNVTATLCRNHNMTCINGVAEYVDEHEYAGEETLIPDDGHWNTRGNELVGEYLVSYFRNSSALS